MNILGIFTLGSSIKKVFSKENVKAFLDFIREVIVDLVKDNDLLGEEKKALVDQYAIEWVYDNLMGNNKTLDWLINKILVPVLPIVTQAVYDFLKERVEDLTN